LTPGEEHTLRAPLTVPSWTTIPRPVATLRAPHLEAFAMSGRGLRRHLGRESLRLLLILLADVTVVLTLSLDKGSLPLRFPEPAVLGLCLAAGLFLSGGYRRGTAWHTIRTIGPGTISGFLLAWLLSQSSAEQGASGLSVAGAAGVLVFCLWGARFLLRTAARRVRPLIQRPERVLVLRTEPEPDESAVTATALTDASKTSHWTLTEIPAVRDCCPSDLRNTLAQTIRDLAPDSLLIYDNPSPQTVLAIREMGLLSGIRVMRRVDSETVEARPGARRRYGALDVVELTAPAWRALALATKRAVDITLAVIGLLVLALPSAIVGTLVRLDSPGPILFRQVRVGRAGRLFEMLKFRTMQDGADAEKERISHLNHSGDPRLFKVRNDPRVTRIGRVLRRWSLDEIPQLWNVLKGDMSLVGPRPFFGSDLDMYEERHFVRLAAQPGVTGLWQIEHRSNDVEFERVVALDRRYVTEWSPFLDARILARTPFAILGRTEAY